MNQRSRNSRSYAAMLLVQLVERRNGRRIAQHDGDLTATGDAGGLALGAGLGCHLRNHQGAGVVTAHVIRAVLGVLNSRPAREGRAILADDEGAIRFSCNRDGGEKLGDLFGGFDFHGLLQSGPIPPMCESYTVTSDVSRGIYA